MVLLTETNHVAELFFHCVKVNADEKKENEDEVENEIEVEVEDVRLILHL